MSHIESTWRTEERASRIETLFEQHAEYLGTDRDRSYRVFVHRPPFLLNVAGQKYIYSSSPGNRREENF
jgi:hypothetical protein